MLSDCDQILNLLYELDEHIDMGRFDAAADVFADATLSVHGGDLTVRGRDEVAAFLRRSIRLHDDGTPKTVHLTVNPVVDVDDTAGTASAQTFFTVFHASDEVPLQPVLGGANFDTFRRTERGWQLASRVVQVRLTGNIAPLVPETEGAR
jgi:hypothetical protein